MAFKGALLRKKLKQEGRTRGFLAELTGKTERTVSRWLNGGNAPKARDLEKISAALNCKPRDFDPSYADEGPGIPVHARVSPASRNAFELLRWRYGVTHTQIIEIAPILFSLVAAKALAVPDEDLALDRDAQRLGLDLPIFGRSIEGDQGFRLDQGASKRGKCFGEEDFDPYEAAPRNLFFEAISRISSETGSKISNHGVPDPGEPVSSIGFAIEPELLAALTGGDPELVEALAFGKIRLLDLAAEITQLSKDKAKEIPDLLRQELSNVKARRRKENEKRRSESSLKLHTWQSFYKRRHPDLDEEYNGLVREYCHKEGWAPETYGEEFAEIVWADPYSERRFVDEQKLRDTREDGDIFFTFNHPIVIRLRELETHRSKLKAKFEEKMG